MSSPTPEIEAISEAEFQAEVFSRLEALENQLTQLVVSHNAVGENIAWLVANTQGVFQMFNNPEMMSQLMGKMMGGGVSNG